MRVREARVQLDRLAIPRGGLVVFASPREQNTEVVVDLRGRLLGLAGLTFASDPLFRDVPGGGLTGSFLSALARPYLGTAGAYLVFLFLLVSSLLAMTGVTIRKVASLEIPQMGAADLGVDAASVGRAGAAVKRQDYFVPELGEGAEMLEGSTEEIVAKLIELLKAKGGLK